MNDLLRVSKAVVPIALAPLAVMALAWFATYRSFWIALATGGLTLALINMRRAD